MKHRKNPNFQNTTRRFRAATTSEETGLSLHFSRFHIDCFEGFLMINSNKLCHSNANDVFLDIYSPQLSISLIRNATRMKKSIFRLLITPFWLGQSCSSSKFYCEGAKYCIEKDLVCDDNLNCQGDESDCSCKKKIICFSVAWQEFSHYFYTIIYFS